MLFKILCKDYRSGGAAHYTHDVTDLMTSIRGHIDTTVRKSSQIFRPKTANSIATKHHQHL